MIQASDILSFLKYYLFSKTKFDVHSPFVYDFVIQVLEDKRNFYAFEELDQLRQKLLIDTREIEIKELGAGSKIFKNNIRKIAHIAKGASKNEKISRLLFRMAAYYKPETIIELGTSLGLSTLYLQKGRSSAKVFTIEGCPATAAIAAENFQILNATNIELVEGNFDEKLEPILKKVGKADLVFIDGNHRYQSTIDYFNTILPYVHNDTILIFDDINWSNDMKKAWRHIKNHPQVTVIFDLYHIGIVFFRKEQMKEEFSLFY